MNPSALSARLRLPVVGAPMFLVSGPELVIAQCTAGIIGAFPALNARPAATLEDWLAEITDALAAWDAAHPEQPAAPFAVNLIVHRSNGRLDQDLATLVRWRVPIVITSLGARSEVNAAIQTYGGLVLHDVIDDGFARKAIDKGADGLIAVAAGAGGHAGTLSPFALVQEIRAWFAGPLLLAGAIASGGAILAARAMGADLAYVGSPFIATAEARAPADYKAMVVEGRAADVIYTTAFSAAAASYLLASVRRAGFDPANLPARGSLDLDLEGDGPKAWRDVWSAGQGIGAVHEVISTHRLIEHWLVQYNQSLQRIKT